MIYQGELFPPDFPLGNKKSMGKTDVVSILFRTFAAR